MKLDVRCFPMAGRSSTTSTARNEGLQLLNTQDACIDEAVISSKQNTGEHLRTPNRLKQIENSWNAIMVLAHSLVAA